MGLALNEWFRMKVKRKRWLAALATRAHLSFNVVGSYGWARWPVRVPVGVVLIVEWKLDDPVLDLASGPNWHRNQHPNWSTCHGCHFFSPPLPTSCDVESVWWKRLETPRRTRLPTPSTPSPQIGAIQLARWFFFAARSLLSHRTVVYYLGRDKIWFRTNNLQRRPLASVNWLFLSQPIDRADKSTLKFDLMSSLIAFLRARLSIATDV